MSGTYCGKDCGICADREQLNCTGCESLRRECTIAECCTGKGHENCETCSYREGCRKLMNRENMPAYIRRQRELQEKQLADAAARKEQAVRRAPLMAKWLSVMFWLTIATIGSGLIEKVPSLVLVGKILTVACGLGVAWAFWQLQGEDTRYRTAAICTLVPQLVSLVVALIGGGGDAPAWTLALSLPATVVELVGAYNKCMAHSCVVGGVNAELGDRWEKVWKWNIIGLSALIGSIVLMLIIPVVGALVALAATVALLVASIMEMVALYRSAEVFKQRAAFYAVEDAR